MVWNRTKAPADERTPEQKRLHEIEVVGLIARGQSLDRIARTLNRPVAQVKRDFERFRKRTARLAEEEVKALRWRTARELEEVRVEAWAAWERSKENAVKIVEEEGNGRVNPATGVEQGNRVTTTTEGQCGDPRYLSIVKDCLKDTRELFGLDEPKKVNVTQNVIDWSALAREIGGPPPDMEAQMQAQIARRKVEALEVKPASEALRERLDNL
jgi:hypothetical protein